MKSLMESFIFCAVEQLMPKDMLTSLRSDLKRKIFTHLFKIDLYLGHLDDIFFIWNSTDEELYLFLMKSIKSISSINLNQKYSKSEIKYLDVLVHKDEQQKLQIILFRNKTDRQFIFR